MLKSLITIAGVAAAAAVLASAAADPAEARIRCRDGFQQVAGNWISTPYCRDNQLAAVARQYGFRVSNVAIRENPNLKRHICRFVMSDIRVRETCQEVGPTNRGYPF